VYLPNEVHANKLTPCSELIISIGYENNGYRFICHIQENVIFYSTQAIFDERHFSRCPLSHPREQMPPGRLIPEIELSAPRPSSVDVSQTSFGHISTNSPSILTVSMATESP